jgi:hypothetical protein
MNPTATATERLKPSAHNGSKTQSALRRPWVAPCREGAKQPPPAAPTLWRTCPPADGENRHETGGLVVSAMVPTPDKLLHRGKRSDGPKPAVKPLPVHAAKWYSVSAISLERAVTLPCCQFLHLAEGAAIIKALAQSLSSSAPYPFSIFYSLAVSKRSSLRALPCEG